MGRAGEECLCLLCIEERGGGERGRTERSGEGERRERGGEVEGEGERDRRVRVKGGEGREEGGERRREGRGGAMHEFRRVCRAFGGPVGVFLFIYLFGGGGMGGLPLPLSREHFGSFGDWQVADVAKQGVLISRGQRLLTRRCFRK